ncbi:3'-5' exonuclease [Streptomyces sp. NPDC051956]|uniref:3'-5' exonuclease n=1 Tax=Streptomyces sp. NPDC051956 TaxID=3365677 RepID=UPI0037D3E309
MYARAEQSDRQGDRTDPTAAAGGEPQDTRGRYALLDDAIRGLRRPVTWHQDRERASRWARTTLADDRLRIVDVQTTGLEAPWAVQIAVIDRRGETLLDDVLDPQAPITPGALALHGICDQQTARQQTFTELLRRLRTALDGQHPLAYNAPFGLAVLEREVQRAVPSRDPATLAAARWQDGIAPYAAWTGLWSAKRGSCRCQRLGGQYNALEHCHALLKLLHAMSKGRGFEFSEGGS